MADYPVSPKPQLSLTKDIGFKTLISQFENGAEQRRKKWSGGKRQFTVVYNALTTTEANILWAFYIARLGAYESFNYTDPFTSTVYVVRFLEDKMSYENFTAAIIRTGLKMIQIL